MLATLIIVLSVAVDQLTKWWARSALPVHPGASYPLWEGVFHLTYVRNDGAAFSILQGQRWLFIVFTSLIILGFLIYLWRKKPAPLLKVAMALIVGGAAGNLIDRIRFGYVEDMFDFRAINFAIFNVADCCVVVGTILLAAWILIFEARQAKRHGEASAAGAAEAPEERHE